MSLSSFFFFFFFFNDTATTEIYTLSLHDALPISARSSSAAAPGKRPCVRRVGSASRGRRSTAGARCRSSSASRSEEHTSELQSLAYLVCRLLLEKKKKKKIYDIKICSESHEKNCE